MKRYFFISFDWIRNIFIKSIFFKMLHKILDRKKIPVIGIVNCFTSLESWHSNHQRNWNLEHASHVLMLHKMKTLVVRKVGSHAEEIITSEARKVVRDIPKNSWFFDLIFNDRSTNSILLKPFKTIFKSHNLWTCI